MIFVANKASIEKTKSALTNNNSYTAISTQPGQITGSAQITPSSSKNIEVISPLTGDNVKSGFVVKGNARTFENTVNIRLIDSSGNLLTETLTTANAPDVGRFGPFEKVIAYQTTDTSGTLEVFQYSAKDGSEIDKVGIPVVFN